MPLFKSPLSKALAAQSGALILTFMLAQSGRLPHMDIILLALLQGALAAILAALLRSARWWPLLHLAFMPSAVTLAAMDLPSYAYAAAFVVMAITYWSGASEQVPLFLSSKITTHRLLLHLPDTPGLRLLDAGSGTGSLTARAARLRPDWQITGIESAPLPHLLASLRQRHTGARSVRGDFWTESFADYDVVYAFLSPVPMPRLWQKARREMKPGSLLVSNSFPVPGTPPDFTLELEDRRGSRLFFYRF